MSYLELFENYLRGRKSSLTIKAYAWTVSYYLTFCANKPTPENAAQFLSYLGIRGNCGGRSLNRHLAALNSFFKNVLKQKLEIEPYSFERKLPIWIDSKEQKKLIAACNNRLARTVIITMLGSGLRLAEIINLKIGDIDREEDGGGFLKTMGKGGRERAVAVSRELIDEIDNYLRQRTEKSNKVFPRAERTIEKIVSEAAKKAKLSVRVTPHTLRHSFASSFLDKGGELLHLKDQLGHVNINTTNIYLHSKPERIRERMPNVLEGKI